VVEMPIKVGKLLKKIVKPKTLVGRVVGAAGSFLGIGGGGAVAGLEIELALFAGIAVAAGYLLGWSTEQIKSFISFLSEESRKKNN